MINLIDWSNSVFVKENVFEFEGQLYEDLRPYLHEPFNQDIAESNIKFRLIIDPDPLDPIPVDDYDYIEDSDLTSRLEKFKP